VKKQKQQMRDMTLKSCRRTAPTRTFGDTARVSVRGSGMSDELGLNGRQDGMGAVVENDDAGPTFVLYPRGFIDPHDLDAAIDEGSITPVQFAGRVIAACGVRDDARYRDCRFVIGRCRKPVKFSGTRTHPVGALLVFSRDFDGPVAIEVGPAPLETPWTKSGKTLQRKAVRSIPRVGIGRSQRNSGLHATVVT